MSLRINQNMSAITAHRHMAVNDANMGKSIERLSSGLRINSAADDAAGLVISETLRTTTSGLAQAMKNTQDGINIIKTTEAALNEIEVQIRNVRDVTLHAANANGNVQMLAADQAQINQALESINRIADQTEFAGRKLLSTGAGNNINNTTFQIGANAGQTATFNLSSGADMHIAALGISSASTAATAAKVTTSAATAAGGVTADEVLTITGALGTASVTLTAGTSFDTRAEVLDAINAQSATTGVKAYFTTEDGSISSYASENTYLTFTSVNAGGLEATGSNQTIVVSSNKAANNGTGIGTISLTDTGTSAGSYDVQSAAAADFETLLTAADVAMQKVNDLRVNLGAFQKNTLESTLSSISVAKENMVASESSIRDTDMAEEMVNFTKSQILTQAAQAMMTQANQAPQNILQMLRG